MFSSRCQTHSGLLGRALYWMLVRLCSPTLQHLLTSWDSNVLIACRGNYHIAKLVIFENNGLTIGEQKNAIQNFYNPLVQNFATWTWIHAIKFSFNTLQTVLAWSTYKLLLETKYSCYTIEFPYSHREIGVIWELTVGEQKNAILL